MVKIKTHSGAGFSGADAHQFSGSVRSRRGDLKNVGHAQTLATFWNQFGSALLWMNARALPLAGLVLILAYWCLKVYFAHEQMPLGVLSQSVFGALPAFLLVFLFFMAVGVGGAFFQTYFLFVPIFLSSDDNLLVWLKKGERPGEEHIKFRFFRKLFSDPSDGQKAFCLCMFTFFVAWIVLFILHDFIIFSDRPWLIFLVLLVFSVFVGYIGFRKIFHYRPIYWKALTWHFMFATSGSISVQLFFIMGSYYLVFDFFDLSLNGPSQWLLSLYGVGGFCFIFALFYAQFGFAKIVVSWGGMLRAMGGVVLVLVVITAVFPPFSNYLARKILSSTASGSRECVVLLWTENEPQAVANIQGAGGVRESVGLRVLTEIDGYYLVRKYDGDEFPNDAIHYVPRSLVAAIKSCR